MREVCVALATYNGARYIEPFLASLRSQSWPKIELVVSDDKSTDDTVSIIEHAWPQASVFTNPEPSGVVGNFNHALSKVRSSYVALADQDDIWLPEKVAKLMHAMQAREAEYPKTPVLIFSDLQIVDADLNLINESFFAAGSKSRDVRHLRDLMISNHIPGCSMLINDALLQRLLPIPQGVMMHDWWIALTAAALGIIDCVDDGLVLYRQHGSNTMGAPIVRGALRKWQHRFTAPAARISDYRRSASETLRTLSLFRDRFHHVMPTRAKLLFDDVLDHGVLRRGLALRGAHTGENLIKSVALASLMPRASSPAS